jgi:HlyD family secretion protein
MMARRFIPIVVLLAVAAAAATWYLQQDAGPRHYTGFVEGEERVIRSEVSGRVGEVHFAEGAAIPAGAVIATLDARDIDARLHAKRQELAVLDAELQTQDERIALVESTWARDLRARQADLSQAESAAAVAERTFAREQDLVRSGASTVQQLDDLRGQRDQTRSAVERARAIVARTEAEERSIAVARHQRDALRAQRELALAQIAELEVTRSKYTIHAPDAATIMQTQLIWPGELAQPGTAICSLLDPLDKYVQIYVPVADVSLLRVGGRVEIELDSVPGQRIPGEVSFVADSATFTPEKIETRSDRMGQVYRVKVRVLEGVEHLQPGTEGNVYLTGVSATGGRVLGQDRND